jgi:hypothetical protein
MLAFTYRPCNQRQVAPRLSDRRHVFLTGALRCCSLRRRWCRAASQDPTGDTSCHPHRRGTKPPPLPVAPTPTVPHRTGAAKLVPPGLPCSSLGVNVGPAPLPSVVVQSIWLEFGCSEFLDQVFSREVQQHNAHLVSIFFSFLFHNRFLDICSVKLLYAF